MSKYGFIGDRIKGMYHMSTVFNSDFSTYATFPFKMLQLDPNPIMIRVLLTNI